MRSAQNFGAHNFVTTTLFESGLGDRPSGPNLGLRNEISYRKGLKFASTDKKCQGLGKKQVFLMIPGVLPDPSFKSVNELNE